MSTETIRLTRDTFPSYYYFMNSQFRHFRTFLKPPFKIQQSGEGGVALGDILLTKTATFAQVQFHHSATKTKTNHYTRERIIQQDAHHYIVHYSCSFVMALRFGKELTHSR